jgi:hypothetical protein
MSYRVLILPSGDSITPGMLRKVTELVKAGATVIGPVKPVKSPSLKDYPQCDAEVKSLADALTIWGKPLTFDAAPDFDAGGANLAFIHRSDGDAEIYFVSNQQYKEVDATCGFRVTGKAPELWYPDTGRFEKSIPFSVKDGRTFVPLHFGPGGSVFVVFRKPGESAPDVKRGTKEIPITGSWRVLFPAWNGITPPAPAVKTSNDSKTTTVTFDTLDSWTANSDPEIKYFSGTALYTKEFDWQPVKGEISLDLGTVKNIAEVSLNGKSLGALWKPPFTMNVTDSLKPGKNILTVKVTNLWPNRLIGDMSLPPEKRRTWTVTTPFKKDSQLLESGLLGPVRLITE